MRISRFHRRAAASILALAMLASACGSDDSKSESSDTTTAPSETTETTAAPPTGEPVKIGTTIWTLPQISLDLRLPGIKAAVEDVNAHGGINGHPLEWVYCPAADANEGEACARKMIDEGVVATVSDANLVAEGPSTQILADAGIPQIDPFVNSPEALNNPNVFMFGSSTPIEYAGVVAYMKEKGLKTIHFLAGAISSAQNSVDSVTAAAEHYGMEIKGGKTEIPLSATDYSPYVAEAADVEADVNVTIIAPFMSGLLLQAAQQLGVQAKLGLSEGQFSSDTVRDFAPELEGSLLVGTVPPFSAADDYPAVKAAVDAIDGYYKESNDPLAAPGKLSTLALRAWFSVQAFAHVANDVDAVTTESVKTALGTAKIDLGLDNPWEPGAAGPEGYARVSNPWMYLSEVKAGKTVLFQKDPIDALIPFKAAG